MALETQAMAILQEILGLEDDVLEKDFDNIVQLFEADGSLETALNEKIAYCRANNLTIDDLIEENKTAQNDIGELIQTLSPIKQKFIEYVLLAAVRINDQIIAKGLHPKAKLRIQRLPNNEKLPAYAHAQGDSGMDVYATEDIVVEPHSVMKSGLGIKVVIPLGYELQVRPKSGMSLNPTYMNLFIANSPGTIDANFRNEIEVILKNLGETPVAIPKGNKFAQLVLVPVIQAEIEEIKDVNDFPTDRTGGFGSTGEK